MLLGNFMDITTKKEELEEVSKKLDSFGDKITNNEDYEKYKILIEEEAKLLKESLIETMMANTEYNKALKEGETPIFKMPELKFQDRSIRVEIQIPIQEPVSAKIPSTTTLG